MGFLGEEYEDDENIPEMQEDPEIHITGENEKKKLCDKLKKIANSILSIAKELETNAASKVDIQSRMVKEIANLTNARLIMNMPQFDDIKK